MIIYLFSFYNPVQINFQGFSEYFTKLQVFTLFSNFYNGGSLPV